MCHGLELGLELHLNCKKQNVLNGLELHLDFVILCTL